MYVCVIKYVQRQGERDDVESCRRPETWPGNVRSEAYECSAYSVKSLL